MSSARPEALKTPAYCTSGAVMMNGSVGGDWKPSWPHHVMFWMARRVPFVRML
jgi:hypothetical protein